MIGNPRYSAIASIGKKNALEVPVSSEATLEKFGEFVFNKTVMKKMLPKEACLNLLNAMDGAEKIRSEFACVIAHAMKEWAVGLGATHYCHWFQPLNGALAEKHDSFMEWTNEESVIEKFSAKQLLQGEPDASSFPSGGLRSTFEARGYTGWDPTSPAFVWKKGNGVILCIPSIFFSWTGDVLDDKIPLLRSERKINEATLRLLKVTQTEAAQVYTTLGIEQEYFIVDRTLKNLRPDLTLAGRTVFGAPSPKGQELQDHYLGSVKDRVLAYMREFEQEALKLGIPVKTRHNEVAPGQYEVAPIFERSTRAVDHNMLLMELMTRVAIKHDLSCLLHEKPFKGLNGSGKHCNWALCTDKGVNLLDPSGSFENRWHFLVLVAAFLKGVHRHSALLRASIAYAENDHRLGGHEAPPAIISVYLGDEIEALLKHIEFTAHEACDNSLTGQSCLAVFDFGLGSTPDLPKDSTDRNRTSPLAFTGNKFEFRAVGSSANPAFAVTVLNTIVAESLNEIMDEVESALGGKTPSGPKELFESLMPVLRKTISESKSIRFEGDNYSKAWQEEASRRGLPFIKKSAHAFEALLFKRTSRAFKDILSLQELKCRYDIMNEIYGNTLHMEASLMLDLFRTQVFPAALRQQQVFSASLSSLKEALGSLCQPVHQEKHLLDLSCLIDEALYRSEELEKYINEALQISDLSEKSLFYCEKVESAADSLRKSVDRLEAVICDELWSLPKYRELLFMV